MLYIIKNKYTKLYFIHGLEKADIFRKLTKNTDQE